MKCTHHAPAGWFGWWCLAVVGILHGQPVEVALKTANLLSSLGASVKPWLDILAKLESQHVGTMGQRQEHEYLVSSELSHGHG